MPYQNSEHTANVFTLYLLFSRNPLEKDGEVLPITVDVDILSTQNNDLLKDDKSTAIYEKYDSLLHGASRKRSDKILSVDFMRKYIHFVKILKPTLTEEASEIISNEYSRLRSEDFLENDVARVSKTLKISCFSIINCVFKDTTGYGAYFGNYDSFSHSARKGAYVTYCDC